MVSLCLILKFALASSCKMQLQNRAYFIFEKQQELLPSVFESFLLLLLEGKMYLVHLPVFFSIGCSLISTDQIDYNSLECFDQGNKTQHLQNYCYC
jgi:hypothetical protein